MRFSIDVIRKTLGEETNPELRGLLLDALECLLRYQMLTTKTDSRDDVDCEDCGETHPGGCK